MFITLTIEAKESRKIVTIDIPRVFLNTEIKENVIMKMVGTLAELMVKTNKVIPTISDIGERKSGTLLATTKSHMA